MEYKKIIDQVRFSVEKMNKINLLETENMFCDLYCLEPGQEQKIHIHQGADKIYFVIDGRGVFRIGDEEKELGKGTVVLASGGMAHGVFNTSDHRLVLLVVMAPNPNLQE